MKLAAIATVFVSILVSGTALAQQDGPFGVEMGSDPASYGCVAVEKAMFTCESVPKAHPDVDYYVVQAYEETGICFVKGIGDTIRANSYGSRLRSETERIAAQVSKSYGKSELTDFLLSGSIWDEPEDWMMSLQVGERFYAFQWGGKGNTPFPNGVQSIYVGAAPLGSDAGYVAIEFYFSNHYKCEDAERRAGADAF